MRRTFWRVATIIVTSTACILTSPAAIAGEAGPSALGESLAGRYVVVLEAAPLALYRGGVAGIPASSPAAGEQLDVRASSAVRYLAHLGQEQQALADAVGVDIAASYRVTLNGFAADLTASQLTALRARDDVVGIVPDGARVPDGGPLSASAGAVPGGPVAEDAWAGAGGAGSAGAGVVIGVIGTGIAADNPSFAGEPLGTAPAADADAAAPHLDGTAVVFTRADGGEFRSETAAGQDWTKSDYTTKVVGAQYFSAGATAAGIDLTGEHLSPLDADGHGSLVAGAAAGAAAVQASVSGLGTVVVSGAAPAARIAAYKACFAGPNVLSRDDDTCMLSDVLAAIDQVVADGADVLDYAVAPGSSSAVQRPEDIALVGAAAAGVVVVTGAGDTGPGPASISRALPGVLTVAASDESGRVAGYSGRGPAAEAPGLAAPSVTAPGFGVVAATAGDPGAGPSFAFASGTSIAAAEVAGLAAVYLGVHPTATVGEVVSALSTTASETTGAETEPAVLAAGSGLIDPSRLLDPGLVLLSGPDEWLAALDGASSSGAVTDAPDAADLNAPAILLPAPGLSDTVTRVVTALRPGIYAVDADVPGFDVSVDPKVLVIADAGETREFTVTITRTDAPAGEWASGSLTWADGDLRVRLPVAVGPADAAAVEVTSGAGAG